MSSNAVGPLPGALTPIPINWDYSEFTAVIVLLESTLAKDRAWSDYVRALANTAHKKGLLVGFFPVTMDRQGLEVGVRQQALRWDRWNLSHVKSAQRLTSDLTHELCRMLRHRLKQVQTVNDRSSAFGRYLEKIRVFISHSKHDKDGVSVANSIRDWIHEHSSFASFFDVYDMPPGLSFEDVLQHEIREAVVLAVHTDSYSSREWCKREVITAKRHLVPMIVVDCVQDVDPRNIPYLGNVPVVRMQPGKPNRIRAVTSCLLEEVFRIWLWLCRVRVYLANSPGVLFTGRPPELIALAAVPAGGKDSISTIVYPDPLISADEHGLFREIAPGVRVQTLTEWLEKRQ